MFSLRKQDRQSNLTKSNGQPDVAWRTPFVDIYESDKGWKVVADLPGTAADGLHVTVDGGRLTVEASNKAIGLGWRRAFTLPDGVTGDGVRAKLENGVLGVDIDRPAKDVPRRIEVKVS